MCGECGGPLDTRRWRADCLTGSEILWRRARAPSVGGGMGPMIEDERMIELIARMQAGDAGAKAELFGELYDELRGRAAGLLAGERPHTLQATALVHEAWLRLAKGNVASARERGHFVALAASAMRSVLVDHARARGALKRGGGSRGVPLDEALEVFASRVPDLLELNEELDRLAELDPRAAKTVELRFFGGLSIAETAGVLEVSAATVERDWSTARDFLAARLAPGPTDAEG